MNENRIILHVDMDSFYASVEVRERPELKDQPVIVGSDPKGGKGRGVVSTCSYEARKYGIHSGIPISRAYRLCPHASYLPVNFKLYTKVSGEVMDILRKYAEKFQQVSVDEAYLDVSSTGSFEAAEQLSRKIKNEIKEKEKITCSIGIGTNKTVAKIASDHEKPDGLTVVEDAGRFLSSLPVRKIPGVGKKTDAELKNMGIETIGQLADRDIQELQVRFGKWAINMLELARGIDMSDVREEEVYKSVSRELTFEEDTDDLLILNRTMEEIAYDVHKALNKEKLLFRTLTIKVRYEDFATHTKARTLGYFTDDINIIVELSKTLLKHFFGEKKVRLIGIKLSGLEKTTAEQKSMDEFSVL